MQPLGSRILVDAAGLIRRHGHQICIRFGRTMQEDLEEHLRNASHRWQLSAMLQYYSSLPFNIATGLSTVQGTSARPTVDGSYIGRNAGTGFDFLNVNARLSRVFPIRERLQIEGIAEAFNLLNHLNGVGLNGTFGTGAYPTNPLPIFKQITAVADPRTLQLALRLRF